MHRFVVGLCLGAVTACGGAGETAPSAPTTEPPGSPELGASSRARAESSTEPDREVEAVPMRGPFYDEDAACAALAETVTATFACRY